MKRFVIFILTLALFVFVVAGCVSNPSGPNYPENPEFGDNTEQSKDPEPGEPSEPGKTPPGGFGGGFGPRR